MYPPSQNLNLDIEALSGICGSISIACWVVVFSPQIIENFQRGSAEGLSVVFIAVWLLGDVFNILGAVLQGVLPTMVILAVYYTLADIVLLGQCFYYKGFTLRDEVPKSTTGNQHVENRNANGDVGEHTSLLRAPDEAQNGTNGSTHRLSAAGQLERTHSGQSMRERFLSIDGTHLSPVIPLHPDPKPGEVVRQPARRSAVQSILFNLLIIVLVCLSGILGWWLSNRRGQQFEDAPDRHETLSFNVLGQVFGWVCAVLYLGSRFPQLLLNFRRKSTEGISMLFFLFACIGNATYVMSIFAYSPQAACEIPLQCLEGEARRMYWRYIVINLSWIMGSFGTLLLDAGVFVQYFMYKPDDESDTSSVIDEVMPNASEASIRRERRRRRSVTFAE